MSEFYIDCPEGQEQGPAIEDVAPYCVPADEANPGEVFPEPLPLDPLPLETQPAPLEGGESAPPQDVTPHTHIEVPVQRELAETGGADLLTAVVFGIILILAGVATWLPRTR